MSDERIKIVRSIAMLRADNLAQAWPVIEQRHHISLPFSTRRILSPWDEITHVAEEFASRYDFHSGTRLLIRNEDRTNDTSVRLVNRIPPVVAEWHEKAQRVDAAEAMVARLAAENAELRAALGYSTDNSPALGGPANQ